MARIAAVVSTVFALGCLAVLVAQERPAYVITEVSIQDRIAYQEYEADFMPTLEPYGGVLVAISDEPAVLEGEWSPERVVVLRFDSRQRALDWYQSSEYQQLAVLRRAMSTGTDILIDGRR